MADYWETFTPVTADELEAEARWHKELADGVSAGLWEARRDELGELHVRPTPAGMRAIQEAIEKNSD